MAEDRKLARPVTEPASEEDASLEARVRIKWELGQPLTREERMFFARMPADKGLLPRRP